MTHTELAEGCVCGDCSPGCANRWFKSCCGACIPGAEDPAAEWARITAYPQKEGG